MGFSVESLIVGAIVFISLLVHEYGHASTAKRFGKEPAIILQAFGGKALYDSRGLTPKQEFLITLNGPLFESLLIFIPFYLLKMDLFPQSSMVHFALYITMRLNILWCLFNLLPIGNLDGGHLLRYLLEKKFGEKGHRMSHQVGIAVTLIAAPYLFSRGLYFFAVMLVIFAVQSYQYLNKTKVPLSPYKSYLSGVDALQAKDLEKAKTILKRLLKTSDQKVKNLAHESLAEVYFQQENLQKSYQLLLNSDHQILKRGKCLLCKLAYAEGNYEIISSYSREIYEIDPTFEIALLNAKAFAKLNRPQHSGAWLSTASQFGDEYLPILEKEISESAFDLVRETDSFKQQFNLINA